ncbi:MAG: GtrA family protein [Bacteroidota bacterium]
MPDKLLNFLIPKLKFGAGSAVSTGIDYTVFFILYGSGLGLSVAIYQAAAQTCGMATNFVIQRTLVFEKNRGLGASFIWSISFSVLGLIAASGLVQILHSFRFFQEYPIVMKVLVTGLFFVFNFYTKQLAFEKKMNW